jgi:hypothetical protein
MCVAWCVAARTLRILRDVRRNELSLAFATARGTLCHRPHYPPQ